MKELITDVGAANTMSESDLISLLMEAKVLTSLHVAEAVKAKLLIIAGLETRISGKELENDLRDYIADNSWLISPEWETFKKERSIQGLIEDAVEVAKLDKEADFQKRIDLALSSGDTLLILEFMRPGIAVDHDHLSRFQLYCNALSSSIEANTGGNLKRVTGYLVADSLNKSPHVLKLLKQLADNNMYAVDWQTLLNKARSQWADFLDLLIDRSPNDDRLKNLKPEQQQITIFE